MMTPRKVAATTFGFVFLALALAGAGLALTLLSWSTPTGDDLPPAAAAVGFTIAALIYSTVGAVLALQRPTNPIGWLFLIAGLFTALDAAHGRYLLYTMVESPDSSLPNLISTGALINSLWLVPLSCTVIVLLTFPEGRTASRPWTVAAFSVVGLALIALVMILIEPGPLTPPFDAADNRFGIETYEDFSFLFNFVILGLALIALAAAVALFRRFRRSTGDEREQLKWFAYVAAWLGPLTIGYVVANILGELEGVVFGALSFATVTIISALPVAIGIAVLKYRLYDIDIIVNRTLVYVPLTAILAGLFTATTGLFRAIFTEVSGFGSDSAVAMSTLAVVAFFTPVKNKLQSFVDRHFKETADPSQPLRALAKEARTVLNVLDSRSLMQEFVDKASFALDATGAAVYLSDDEEPLLTSGVPDGPYALTFSLDDSGFMLGRLNVGPSRSGRPYTPEQVKTLDEETDVLSRTLALYLASAPDEGKSPGLSLESPDSVPISTL